MLNDHKYTHIHTHEVNCGTYTQWSMLNYRSHSLTHARTHTHTHTHTHQVKCGTQRQRSMLNEYHERISRDVRVVTRIKTAALRALTTHQCDIFNADSNKHRSTLAPISKRQSRVTTQIRKLTNQFNVKVNLPTELMESIRVTGMVHTCGLPPSFSRLSASLIRLILWMAAPSPTVRHSGSIPADALDIILDSKGMTTAALKRNLKKRGCITTGQKQDLAYRLRFHIVSDYWPRRVLVTGATPACVNGEYVIASANKMFGGTVRSGRFSDIIWRKRDMTWRKPDGEIIYISSNIDDDVQSSTSTSVGNMS